ncbi:MAG TPA: hypothetical protein VMS01_07005 [Stellaceae bacterium]|nr:hypothetical protein [Stellaceae bacterium]
MAARSAAGLFADVGAEIACIDPDRSTPLTQYLNHGKGVAASEAVGRALRAAGLIVCEGRPRDLRARLHMLLRVNRFVLCSRFRFGGRQVHADIVATMLANGERRLLTFNGAVCRADRTARPSTLMVHRSANGPKAGGGMRRWEAAS